MPDAAGLVLASDQDDARAYAEIVERVTGEAPVLILSDDPKASDKIAAFTTGTERIAVCVRMVSEGVDVPRAACLAWMTSLPHAAVLRPGAWAAWCAPGRRHESATVFLPAVRPLLALAAELETSATTSCRRPGGRRGAAGRRAPRRPSRGERDRTRALDAEASFAHVLHGGRAVVAGADDAELSEDDEDFLGLPGMLSPEQTAALLARRDAHARRRADGLRPDGLQDVAAGADAAGPGAVPVGGLAGRRGAADARSTGWSACWRPVPAPRTARCTPSCGGRCLDPASAAASAELLERRRDHLMEQLGGVPGRR